jgi:hypothetical protein
MWLPRKFGTVTESLYFEIRKCLIPAGGFMDIIGALKQEESKLQRHLTAVQGAIAALNGGSKTAVSTGHASSTRDARAKRTLSAVVRAKMSRAAKARWAKIRVEKAKKAK